ncbi:hypothetical protein [Zophobihabitans entericus]|uniref:Uncharacterized protein n=1 Tax=Zophobihabitans entericus TaxID=1635327 RepID=A0A6G9I7P6_9GAMM|nr:hypothetical protein [Zophobihabitans entericus]QIQ20226.1 hypothetical protein IPMB12_00125 [Zophobihabitans entericus]
MYPDIITIFSLFLIGALVLCLVFSALFALLEMMIRGVTFVPSFVRALVTTITFCLFALIITIAFN